MRISDVLGSFAEICYKPLGEKGEDALAYNLSRLDMHAMAVFDGCGGAGAWKYPEYRNASGAFVAAQSMAELFLAWFDSQSVSALAAPGELADSFHHAADERLQALKRRCAPMGVAGSLVKSFPCTASVAITAREERDSILLTALNAGDSRVYFLSPSCGLIQLTQDDSRGHPDALQNLRDNAALSNLLNADKPFQVSVRQARIKLPCAVICATDGAFGFLRSPMDFEHMLLKALLSASSMAAFEQLFESAVREATGDDSTCLLSFYGWNSYDGLKDDLQQRFAYVQRLIDRMDDAGEDRAAAEQVILQTWQAYKKQTVWDEMQG